MNIIETLKGDSPLIHCLTNSVTANDCANALLAIGARPVMAEHPDESAQITSVSSALLVNTGTPTSSKIEAIKNSVRCAYKNNIPYVLDCVGISSSTLRLNFVRELISENLPTVIKGNSAEISALSTDHLSFGGVNSLIQIEEETAYNLAKELRTVIFVTGKRDIITDGKKIYVSENGCQNLSKITGSGCMLGCLCAAFLTVSNPLDASVLSAAIMGICGELADIKKGLGTFRVSLMDNLSTITDIDIKKYIKVRKL